MTVLLLALGSVARGSARADAAFLVDRGIDVTVVTSKLPADGSGLDGRVRLVALGDYEDRHVVRRTERALVLQLPKQALRAVRRSLSLGFKVRRLARPTALAVRAVQAATGAQERGSWKVHRAFNGLVYRSIRGWVLWRVAHRHLLPTLDVGALDLVVATDSWSVPVAWHLARQHPGLEVALRLDRSRFEAGEAAGARGGP